MNKQHSRRHASAVCAVSHNIIHYNIICYNIICRPGPCRLLSGASRRGAELEEPQSRGLHWKFRFQCRLALEISLSGASRDAELDSEAAESLLRPQNRGFNGKFRGGGMLRRRAVSFPIGAGGVPCVIEAGGPE